jgi:Protein of unknown function (DUF3887)
MADVAGPVSCEACGRLLPPQQGKGRRRRYCDATCRSAARRDRALGRRRPGQPAQASLTTSARHANLNNVNGTADVADPVALRISSSARRLVGELVRSGADSPLGAMAAARELSAATDTALQESVDRARSAGHSWREIGGVLGTTRQAAFQRFGRPVDPRTGQPMVRDVPPAVADRAVAIFVEYAEGRWEEVRRDFDENLRERLDAARLAAGWAHTVGLIGGLERMGEPIARQAGDDTVVTIPLHFEAAEAAGMVRFDRDGKIAGLAVRPASQ